MAKGLHIVLNNLQYKEAIINEKWISRIKDYWINETTGGGLKELFTGTVIGILGGWLVDGPLIAITGKGGANHVADFLSIPATSRKNTYFTSPNSGHFGD